MFNKKKKKEKNCNKLLALFTTATALLFGLVGVGVGLMKTQYKSALAVSYDDEDTTITFNANELNDYFFDNFASYIRSLSSDDFTDIGNDWFFTYGESVLSLDENIQNDSLNYEDENIALIFVLEQIDSFGTFKCLDKQNDYVEIDFNTYLVLNTQGTFYSDTKSAIELDIQANQLNPQQPMLDFVQILIGGIVSVANGVATGVSTMAKALFLEVNSQGAIIGLSVFGGIIAIFSGLALAIAITSKVYTWITSLGN